MQLDRLKTAAGLDLKGKRVLVRADLNVPAKNGKVTDATRLERIAPGLEDLADRGARIIVMSHFGRPKGGPDPQYSLKPVAEKLGELLGRPVAFATDCIGEPAVKLVASLRDGDIAVLENLRFHAGEEKNDPAFAKELAKLGDIFVGDAFSTAHRAHASTDAITRLLPSYAGPLLMEEVDALRSVVDRPVRPTAAVIGGAKVSTKIPVLTNLAGKVDKLIIGGGMANTFFLAQGVNVGKSLAEPDFAKTALEIMHAA
jgi:phosphoglycerate kinase